MSVIGMIIVLFVLVIAVLAFLSPLILFLTYKEIRRNRIANENRKGIE